MKHTLIASVQDQPGVLVRVMGMFRRRAFNVESLTVGHSETPGVSRMTFVVDTSRISSRIVEANLRKLVPVFDVHDVTHLPTVSRELALIRVRCAEGERSQVNDLISIFRARIVDVATDTVIVEITGDPEKVDGLVELLRPRHRRDGADGQGRHDARGLRPPRPRARARRRRRSARARQLTPEPEEGHEGDAHGPDPLRP